MQIFAEFRYIKIIYLNSNSIMHHVIKTAFFFKNILQYVIVLEVSPGHPSVT